MKWKSGRLEIQTDPSILAEYDPDPHACVKKDRETWLNLSLRRKTWMHASRWFGNTPIRSAGRMPRSGKRFLPSTWMRSLRIRKRNTAVPAKEGIFSLWTGIRLDTFPFMKSAIHLYEQLGFQYIEKYNDNPAEDAVFMQLSL